jgi:ribosomal-protein-alanine N-acetyltransferase
MPDVHPDPQLVYAMFERFTGNGYATEMARAAITHARMQHAFATIFASVDEANVASVRILEKLGFKRYSSREGAFGKMFLCRLDDGK